MKVRWSLESKCASRENLNAVCPFQYDVKKSEDAGPRMQLCGHC